MKSELSNSIDKLLQTEDQDLKELHKILLDSIHEEKLITKRLKHESKAKLKLHEYLSDRLAYFGGSWRFILIFLAAIIFWIVINIYVLTTKAFDPYPFILLNLILSCIAAIQSPIILMSQNRLEKKDRKRSEHDYLINLKAELEIRALHQKMDLLMLNQMSTLIETQKQQMVVLKKLEEQLNIKK